MTGGTLYAVGVGPGDPELLTVKAARLIAGADVIAYHSGTKGTSIARSIVAEFIPTGVTEELLAYPVTVGPTDHADGYYGEIEEFYDASAARLAEHLAQGRSVVVLAEGDPLFYSSYMYLHDRLADRFRCEIVPGVTSVSASSAAVGVPLVRHEDVLTVLPGTLPVPELARRLAGRDAVVIMKLGRTFAGVREALRQAGRLGDAVYVERASTGREVVRPVAEVDPDAVPYFSSIVVPGPDRRADSGGRARRETSAPSTSGLGRPHPGRAAGHRSRSRSGPLGHPGGDRCARPGRSRRRLRTVRGPGAAASGSAAARQRQHRRARPGPVGPGSGVAGREGRPGLRRRRRGLRDGVRRVRGRGGRPGVRERAGDRAARGDRGPGRRGSGGGTARRRLHGVVAVRSAEVVGGDRAPAAGGRDGRPGDRALQPRVAQSHDAGGRGAGAVCSSTAPPPPRW